MVTITIGRRMRKLRSLLNIRLGPGAAILPPSITRLHLNFAYKINDGHMGPRKFWRACLPRLKYHNPGVAMTVERTADQEGPASLVVSYGGAGGGGQQLQPQREDGETSDSTQKSINCKHRTDVEILDELMRVTNGRAVEASAEEEQQLRELKADTEKSERDRRKMKSVLGEKKKQQRILDRAKNAVEGEA